MNGNGTVIWGAGGGQPFARALHQSMRSLKGSEAVALNDIVDGLFPVGETKFQTEQSVWGKSVVIVQDVANVYAPGSLNDKLMAAYLMTDAAKRSGAEAIHVVLPYLPYGRQDKPDRKHNEPASGALVAQMFDGLAGSSTPVYVHTVDLHSEQGETLFRNAHLINYQTAGVIGNFAAKELGTENLVLGATDTAGSKRNRPLAEVLRVRLVGAVKDRDPVTNEILAHYLQGNVNGKRVLIHDDMIDTGGTMLETVDLMRREGAAEIAVSTSHLLFTKDAEAIFAHYLRDGRIKRIIATNSVYKDDAFKARNPQITFLPVEMLIGKNILNITEGNPVEYM